MPQEPVVTPADPQHGVIDRSQPTFGGRSIPVVNSVESLQ